ncbi:hypothetical protein PG987_010393 [Apiospora arundinis]
MTCPPELRVMIYELVLAAEDEPPMVRTLAFDWAQRGLHVLTSHEAYLHPSARGLLMTNPEAYGEARRMDRRIQLPARLVTFPGTDIAHPDLGLLDEPLISEPADGASGAGGDGGTRLFNPAATVFYTDQPSLLALFNAVAMGLAPAGRFAWLTDLLLDRRTFEHVLWLSRPSGAGRRPNVPFPALPGLRRLVVGFLHRWQDVAVLEGPYPDVVEEIDVDVYHRGRRRVVSPDSSSNSGEEGGQDDDEDDGLIVDYVVVRPRRAVHSMIIQLVSETVLHTAASVRALNRAGVQVTWAVVWQGVTRRHEINLGP